MSSDILLFCCVELLPVGVTLLGCLVVLRALRCGSGQSFGEEDTKCNGCPQNLHFCRLVTVTEVYFSCHEMDKSF